MKLNKHVVKVQVEKTLLTWNMVPLDQVTEWAIKI